LCFDKWGKEIKRFEEIEIRITIRSIKKGDMGHTHKIISINFILFHMNESVENAMLKEFF